MMHDASVETEESHAGKVLLRYNFIFILLLNYEIYRLYLNGFSDRGTRGTSIYFRRVDGSLTILPRVTTSIQYLIKRRKTKPEYDVLNETKIMD